jgi:putative tryptophan/tyrosine transport system substrate-binding protein
MDRRTFIGTLGIGLLIAAIVPGAQPAGKVRRIGLLMIEEFPVDNRQGIRTALRERGWVEGGNLIVESRSADGSVARLRTLADELVKLNVELIVGAGTVASQAAKNATTRIPIVIYGSGDPVATGLVASLARPGANITGNTTMSPDLDVKRVQLLRELLPAIARVGVLVNPSNPVFRFERDAQEKACRLLGLQPIFVEVTAVDELESAVVEMARRGAQALIVSADPLFASTVNGKIILRAAQRLALPTMGEGDAGPENGALISLSPNVTELNRQLASLIDRILKRAKPGDLPIEQPTTFELVINLETAKALSLTIPQALLLRADRVIQ